MTDREEEGHWCWITGEAVDYSNWNKEEPNDNENENYAMFFYQYLDESWSDGSFSEKKYDGSRTFICEWE